MRLAGLVFASIVVLSSGVTAQHSQSTPAAPAPAPAPTVHSSPPSSPSVSSSSSSGSAASHASPATTSTPSTSSAGSTSHTTVNHTPSSSSPTPSTGPTSAQPSAHLPESGVKRVEPLPRIGETGKIVPSPKVGEDDPPKEGAKPESDLRRMICPNGPCKPGQQGAPPPENSDLRRVICRNGNCRACPGGQAAGKNGQCAPTTQPPVEVTCPGGQVAMGSSCVQSSQQCPAGSNWNGVRCDSVTECATATATASALAEQPRGLRLRMRQACQDDPSSQECLELKSRYESALSQYRVQWNGVPVQCRGFIPDPGTL